jgi:hypothetical protein
MFSVVLFACVCYVALTVQSWLDRKTRNLEP